LKKSNTIAHEGQSRLVTFYPDHQPRDPRGLASDRRQASATPAASPPVSRTVSAPVSSAHRVRSASAYVHFPWCLAKCPYCDFVSYVTPSIDHKAYADAVLRELGRREEEFAAPVAETSETARRLETVFFGGGTPSLWDAVELGRVLSAVRHRLAGGTVELERDDVEVTVECNPTSLDEDRARKLLDAGVNRLSIGVQSLREERLRYLGRLHDVAGAKTAVRGALASGMPRVSADLIFGLPGQSPEDARAEALELVDLGITHVSCYQLTIEPGTRFGELARRGRLPLADDGAVADAFLAIDEALGGLGFGHYEISNYARPGEEARHNLGYWRGDEYLGLGCGAYGFLRASGAPVRGTRWRNEVDPARYMAGAPDSLETLDAETLLRERIMLGIRLEAGFDLEASARELGVEAWTPDRLRAAAWLEGRGRLERVGSRLRVPRAAWLFTDDTAARLF
jgi:putative oxygen-independent coproporphyrinogen III oxidase